MSVMRRIIIPKNLLLFDTHVLIPIFHFSGDIGIFDLNKFQSTSIVKHHKRPNIPLLDVILFGLDRIVGNSFSVCSIWRKYASIISLFLGEKETSLRYYTYSGETSSRRRASLLRNITRFLCSFSTSHFSDACSLIIHIYRDR